MQIHAQTKRTATPLRKRACTPMHTQGGDAPLRPHVQKLLEEVLPEVRHLGDARPHGLHRALRLHRLLKNLPRVPARRLQVRDELTCCSVEVNVPICVNTLPRTRIEAPSLPSGIHPLRPSTAPVSLATLYKSCGPSTKYPTSRINATSGVPTLRIPELNICRGRAAPRALRGRREAEARAWCVGGGTKRLPWPVADACLFRCMCWMRGKP